MTFLLIVVLIGAALVLCGLALALLSEFRQ